VFKIINLRRREKGIKDGRKVSKLKRKKFLTHLLPELRLIEEITWLLVSKFQIAVSRKKKR
jgi:hypothetical protein